MLNGQMRQVVLPSHATVEDLYDFVFSETEGNCYFSITKSFPTMLINEMGKSLMEVVGDMESVTVNRIWLKWVNAIILLIKLINE